jgi:HAMP domain-containing protein
MEKVMSEQQSTLNTNEDASRALSEIARVVTAVANGDFTTKVSLETSDGKALPDDALKLAQTINTLVEQLNHFAYELTRVSREMGSQGRFGGQADVPGFGGTWKDLVANFNQMSSDLTMHVRALADAAQAAQAGDSSRRVTVEMQGEMAEFRDALNRLIERQDTAKPKSPDEVFDTSDINAQLKGT